MKVLSMMIVALALLANFAGAGDVSVKSNSNSSLPPAQLGISPPRIEKVVAVTRGERLNQSIIIYNYGDKPKLMTLSLVDIDSKKNPVKPSKKTLSHWAIMNPLKFSIAPGGQQTVRLSIRPPIGFPKGKHVAEITIESVIKNPVQVDKDKKTASITLGASYGLPVIIEVE